MAQFEYAFCENQPVSRVDPSGLKWQTTGPDPDLPQPTIVCDGKGGIRIFYPKNWPSNTDACVKDCLDGHENCHAKDALASNPDICKGKPDGTGITATGREWKASEAKCRKQEMDCLKAYDIPCPTVCNSQAIVDRIRQLRGEGYPE